MENLNLSPQCQHNVSRLLVNLSSTTRLELFINESKEG